MSVVMTASVERGLMKAACDFASEVVHELGRRGMLSVDVSEALAVADVSHIVSSRSKASSKREAMRGGEKKDSRPKMILPCCGEVIKENCFGVKFNHGLHTQCLNKKGEGQEYCKTCQKNADCSATGKPPYGDIRSRVKFGVDYRDPKGKLTTPYANVVEKMGLNLDAAHEAAAEFGWTIPAEQLVKRVAKRGRPSKSAAVSDTDSDTSEVPKKRGRKPKAKKKASTEEDQIASLVAEAYQESESSEGDKIQMLCNEAKKEAAEQAKADKAAAKLAKAAEKKAKKEAAEQAKADKAAAKLAKAAEMQAKKEAAEQAKADKAAAKLAKAAEKEAKKEAADQAKADKAAAKLAKAAEKEAKKEAAEQAKADKAAAKLVKAAEKEAKKEAAEQAKADKAAAKLAKAAEKEAIQVNPETEELVEEESYDTMEVEGVTYIVQMDEDSGLTGLYHVETGEPVGIWDEESGTIQECEYEGSDDEEE